MACSHRLTCLKIELNNFIKIRVADGQLFAHFCLGASVWMNLKLSEGIILDYLVQLYVKKSHKILDFDFHCKKSKNS